MDSASSNLNYRSFTAKLLAKSITGKSCSICLCTVEDRRSAVIIPCMHAYCIRCIRKWSNLKRKCPLCNADFDSWFFNIDLSAQTFQKEKLLAAPTKGKEVIQQDIYARRLRRTVERQRLIRRSREEFNGLRSRTRPLPWRRSFCQEDEHPDALAERVLRWRASIYEQHLQAEPFSSKNSLLPEFRCYKMFFDKLDFQQIIGSDDAKRTVLQRLEPWIRRELHTILGDPDPSVIVHVATSLLISRYQQMQECPSGELGVQNDFLAPLRPFLQERTDMFWHELRCFAESSFSMGTYDGVVKYRRMLD